MIATLTLNPSIDQHLVVPALLKDDTNRAVSVTSFPGGKGVNVSKVVRELGGPTWAYGLVAGWTGKFWESLVRKLDIPFSTLFVQGETRINTILTDVKDRTQTRISALGPKVSTRDIRRFSRKLLASRPRPFLWALGGSLPVGAAPSAYKNVLTALQKEGVPCILDTDGEALKKGIEAKPFLIKPNEHEMGRLAGHSLKTVPDYLKAAKAIVKRGVRVVVVSLAAKGALFVTEKEAFHVLVPDVPVRSKVGAGDSLIGGFALGLYRRMPLVQAACLGAAASTSAVMREAPRLCWKTDIAGLLPRIRVRWVASC
ncbi:MAG: 1-phosphofructokinase family hexose kinase [Candidatus Omnitrophica bacterium]|nr:1-phosphofructokinase family hexose kinase [Candidatus Omnitrophota bacterium]